MKEEWVPEVGKTYHFFDDGKISHSRHYLAKIEELITFEKAKEVFIESYRYGYTSLYNIWREEIDEHRQGENFKVIGKGVSTETGAPWLYAEDTDYFVKGSIPTYDESDVWFVRTVQGGWFSLDTVNTWMGGELDITGNLYKSLLEYET